MRGTVVGILRGGPSVEHEASLRTGHAVMSTLPRERYTVRDIFIDRDGVWHERGIAADPAKVLCGMDVAINALHGRYGEDGEVQKILERFGTPYTGSDSFASFVAMHKVLSKEKARTHGIGVPRYVLIERPEDAAHAVHDVIRTYPQPVIVKPVHWKTETGTQAPAGYQPVHQAVTGLFAEGASGALVEEHVRGTRASVGVVEQMRGEELYALPAVETTPHGQDIAPGRFQKEIAIQLQDIARLMHRELGLRHYSRSDFMVSPKGIYYLGTRTLPALTADSRMPKALASVGISFADFVDHVIALALAGGRR